MFVDASALAAILTDERDARDLLARLDEAEKRLTSPLAIWETAIAVARILKMELSDAQHEVEAFLKGAAITVVPVAPEATSIAIAAYARYGKKRHGAGLNLGDCFAYACARHARVKLLYKGDDFAHTDIESG
ncbi:MAG: type II toxin-antitoxin system VapC family toxin [Alphaproteobacteria bacterium]|nr:type II toxin-antitoxin system VapC family toxin [Alphaproteobacteria bacterium]